MTDLSARLNEALAGRYRIERELGAGGMATVYVAEDLRHHRQVAIKVLRHDLAMSLGADRFLREIEIAARLHHPHILPLYDSGGTGDVLFYVMPLVEGQSLRDRLARGGALPVDEAVRILREVADALAYSHEHGVVHRDIKPENILLSSQHALVTDFGVAKAVSEAATSSTMTGTGIALGTPSYMAPEQAMADPALDHRVDIYAVGVLAYEILAGRAPFVGNPQQILAGHLAQRPESLSVLRPTVPAVLDAIVMRCLEKNPADRWQGAAELRLALEGFGTSSGSHVSAALSPASSPAPRGQRRWNRAVVGIGAGILVALAGLAWFTQVGRAGTLIGNDVLAENDMVLVAEFENRTEDSSLAATITDAIRVELQQSRAVQVMSQAAMWAGLARMGLEHGALLPEPRVQELAEREGAKAFVVGDIARLGNGYQISARVVATSGGADALTARATAADESGLIEAVGQLGRDLRSGIGESLRSVMAAPRLAQVTTTSLPALRAYTAAQRLHNEGSFPRAVAMAREAVALDSTFAAAWGLQYAAYSNMNSVRLASEAARRAYELRDRLSEFERLRTEARYHGIQGNDTAEEAAWARLAELGRDEANYANMLMERHRLAEAEAMSRRAVTSMPKSAIAYWNLAEAQIGQRRFAAAESTLQQLIAEIPSNPYRHFIRVATIWGRRDFDQLDAYLGSGESDSLGSREVNRCVLDLMRGRIRAWRACPNREPPGGLGPTLAIADFRLTGDSVRVRAAAAAFLAAPRDERDPDQYAGMIALLADAGRVREARSLLDEWRSRVGPADPGFRADSAQAVGALAAAEGQWSRAVSAFLAWNVSPAPSAYHLYNRGLPEAAAILARQGQADSAIVLFEKALAVASAAWGAIYEAGWYTQALVMLGDLYEGRGDRERAAEYYGRYIEVLKDADPPIAAQVAAVREKRARVTGEAGRR